MNEKPIEFFEKFKDVRAFFTLKSHGNMKGETGVQNKEPFADEYFRGMGYPVLADTQHGSSVYMIGQRNSVNCPKIIDVTPKCDATVTRCKQVPIAVTGADCFPLFIYDHVNKVIGIIHASYKSLEERIIPRTIVKFLELGADKKNMMIMIGPGICQKCYEFDAANASQIHIFQECKEAIRSLQGDKCLVDLSLIIRYQLANLGLGVINVWESRICTFENENLFSFRRDKTNPVQAGMAVICML